MAIQFDSDSSVAADGFAASVDCPAGTGRRRQQVNSTADAAPAGGVTSEANTTYGIIGVKVWIFRGEVLGGLPTEEKPAPKRGKNRK